MAEFSLIVALVLVAHSMNYYFYSRLETIIQSNVSVKVYHSGVTAT